ILDSEGFRFELLNSRNHSSSSNWRAVKQIIEQEIRSKFNPSDGAHRDLAHSDARHRVPSSCNAQRDSLNTSIFNYGDSPPACAREFSTGSHPTLNLMAILGISRDIAFFKKSAAIQPAPADWPSCPKPKSRKFGKKTLGRHVLQGLAAGINRQATSLKCSNWIAAAPEPTRAASCLPGCSDCPFRFSHQQSLTKAYSPYEFECSQAANIDVGAYSTVRPVCTSQDYAATWLELHIQRSLRVPPALTSESPARRWPELLPDAEPAASRAHAPVTGGAATGLSSRRRRAEVRPSNGWPCPVIRTKARNDALDVFSSDGRRIGSVRGLGRPALSNAIRLDSSPTGVPDNSTNRHCRRVSRRRQRHRYHGDELASESRSLDLLRNGSVRARLAAAERQLFEFGKQLETSTSSEPSYLQLPRLARAELTSAISGFCADLCRGLQGHNMLALFRRERRASRTLRKRLSRKDMVEIKMCAEMSSIA
uniref:Uncharacterized protein n=1 Tax=Macrostomum lignano TaxID=282301 RepID=A0A1I8F4L1_9PLAT